MKTPVKLHPGLRGLLCLALLCGPAAAAPVLRLSTNALIWDNLTEGSQSICVDNAGDGKLALTASAEKSGAGWLTVTAGAVRNQACSGGAGQSVLLNFAVFYIEPGSILAPQPVNFATSVVISDPNAIDAPQVVTVSASLWSGWAVELYMAPGTRAQALVSVGSQCGNESVSTSDGGTWLSLGVIPENIGTYAYPVDGCGIVAILAPPASMASGTYSGSMMGGLPVTMHLSADTVAVPSVSQISVKVAQFGAAVSYPFLPAISFSNPGTGTLRIQGVFGMGVGVSASQSGQLAMVTVDPGSREPGTYTDGRVTVLCNGANCPLQIPVSLTIVPQGSPAVAALVDNATFQLGIPVAPGDVCLVLGAQLSSAAPAIAAAYPLPTSLGGATVLVNGVPAPIYYSSSWQIAFQMPYNLLPGTAQLQVVRDGQAGNTVTVGLVASAPELLAVTDAAYNIRDATHPSHAGETLILWAIGLGATNPPVVEGAAAPLNPPAVAVSVQFVQFGNTPAVTPGFAGLSGGSVGLYQVNVTVPASVPKGATSVGLLSAGWGSNSLPLLVQ